MPIQGEPYLTRAGAVQNTAAASAAGTPDHPRPEPQDPTEDTSEPSINKLQLLRVLGALLLFTGYLASPFVLRSIGSTSQ